MSETLSFDLAPADTLTQELAQHRQDEGNGRSPQVAALLSAETEFVVRHIGANPDDIDQMLAAVGVESLDELLDRSVPDTIRLQRELQLQSGCSEREALTELREIAAENQIWRSFLGMGYADCITPAVIQRNVLENPGWYTQYTPYQAEIAQGRLEALLNFQTMVIDLTGLEIANASLLDEATAAAEAMTMSFNLKSKPDKQRFWVSQACHPQTIAVVQTRAQPLGIEVVVGNLDAVAGDDRSFFGALLQYPTTDGAIVDYREFVERLHAVDALVTVAADLLSLTLLKPPGEFGADIAVGSSQRFGVPLGYGGPHAAFFATRSAFARQIPGRVVGISKDAAGKPALRLALQTREQHIRRDKATSNICTAQVLLAVMASMYAVYHGARGLRRIADRVHTLAIALAAGLKRLGYDLGSCDFFDTVRVELGTRSRADILARAAEKRIDLRSLADSAIGIAVDEVTSVRDLEDLWEIFAGDRAVDFSLTDLIESREWQERDGDRDTWQRQTPYLTHPVFNRYHSETEILRYLHRLQARDLSLTESMIPLGSCTMKLNATAEMIPVTWPEFGNIHPFAPLNRAKGYQKLFDQLTAMLAEITGFSGVSLQPNAGSQGEFAGLLAIRSFHASRGDRHRTICLIPQSAHGTNPASAVMAGMKVVSVTCDEQGNIDIADLKARAEKHSENLAALMITYPSTHGVFETGIREVCDVVHQHGGQVYMDGANLNAQVGA
ncbi:MAG: aminomethyl-transferring glycine dehydrogenase, partial [Cyanobacteria bacterium P01_E01_bin.48]